MRDTSTAKLHAEIRALDAIRNPQSTASTSPAQSSDAAKALNTIFKIHMMIIVVVIGRTIGEIDLEETDTIMAEVVAVVVVAVMTETMETIIVATEGSLMIQTRIVSIVSKLDMILHSCS